MVKFFVAARSKKMKFFSKKPLFLLQFLFVVCSRKFWVNPELFEQARQRPCHRGGDHLGPAHCYDSRINE